LKGPLCAKIFEVLIFSCGNPKHFEEKIPHCKMHEQVGVTVERNLQNMSKKFTIAVSGFAACIL
jgi:hypothetical protein